MYGCACAYGMYTHAYVFFNFRKEEMQNSVQPPVCKGEKTLPQPSWLPLQRSGILLGSIPAQCEQKTALQAASPLGPDPISGLFRSALRGAGVCPVDSILGVPRALVAVVGFLHLREESQVNLMEKHPTCRLLPAQDGSPWSREEAPSVLHEAKYE